MIIAVTPNPALDITYQCPRVEIGEVHRIEEYVDKPGGKGVNVARVLAQFGEPVTLTGFLGGDTGQRIEQLLQEVPGAHLIEPAWIHIDRETRRSVAVISGDDATVFNEAGPAVSWEHWAKLHAEITQRARREDVVTISGSLPREAPAAALPAIIADLRELGAKIIVDTSGANLISAAAAGATLLKPNHHELKTALGTDSIDAGAHQLLAAGAKAVAVSSGSAGMALYLSDQQPPITVKPPHVHGNPTGAGDAAVAAWSRILNNAAQWEAITAGDRDTALQAVIEAVATSAAAVARPVAGEVDLELYQKLKDSLRESLQH